MVQNDVLECGNIQRKNISSIYFIVNPTMKRLEHTVYYSAIYLVDQSQR